MNLSTRTISLPLPAAPHVPFKLRLIHLWRNGHLPNLSEPRTFNELVQARKIHDRDPRLPVLADKLRVKKVVARVLGEEWVIPTLWSGTRLPDTPQWPMPFVIKSNHASCQCAFIRHPPADWPEIVRRTHGWTKRRYGFWLDEWLYREIRPQLLVEPFVGPGDRLPTDYKIFVFGGRAEFVQVDTDREHDHKRALFDRDWRKLPCTLEYPMEHGPVARPRALEAMIDAAETLARDFDFVRVDFYEVAGQPLFGEMTFYPGSGLDRFRPFEFDRRFGECWRRARARSPSW